SRLVQPDVIHSHSSKAGFLARLLPFFGIKAAQVYHPHAYVGMRPNPGGLDPVYNIIESLLGRTAYTIVTSSGEKIFASERLRIPLERIYHCPNGVDSDLFCPISAEEKCRRREALGLPLDAPILGFIGRSSAQKDPMILYRAFTRAAADIPIVLFHVGKGELDTDLARLTRDLKMDRRIFRVAYMSTPADFYHVVDGFILTSRYEGFSLAALEALASNLPMILSDAPGNRDLLELPLSHVWNALPGNIEGFARAIKAWYEKLEAGTAVNHRQIALSRFNIRDHYATIFEIYSELAAAVRSRQHRATGLAPLES
ncbi:MAG: glycosyltransferase, partial [Patescibacteria group bacterium]|nr:glycosyltransferase [Patescibacteria group bacterium]